MLLLFLLILLLFGNGLFSLYSPKKERHLIVFQLIRECYKVLQDWLVRLQSISMQARYEMTFATALCDVDKRNIKVPISYEASPLNCLSFVHRQDLLGAMRRHVQHHQRILVNGFCHLETAPKEQKLQVPHSVWAAYIASGEVTKLLLGVGGGAKGTILHSSLEEADAEAVDPEVTEYDTLLWVPHPNFVEDVRPEDSNNYCVTEAVRPSLCHVSMPETSGPVDSDLDQTGNPLLREFEFLEGKLPANQIESLKGLRFPSQYVKCVQMMYFSMVKAGNPLAHSGILPAFQTVNPDAIGASLKAVNYTLSAWADQVLALHKVEYAERLVAYMLKYAPDDAPIHEIPSGDDKRDPIKKLYKCNTQSEISAFYAHHLGGLWPDPIIPDRTVQSAGKCKRIPFLF